MPIFLSPPPASLSQQIYNDDAVAPDWITELAFKGVKGMEKIDHAALLDWATNGYLWFDYFSVPQIGVYNEADANADLVAAVESVPAYVELFESI